MAMLPVAAVALAVVAATCRAGWPRWTPRNRVWHAAEAVPVQAAYLLSLGETMTFLAARTGRAVGDFDLVAMSAAAPVAFLFAWSLRAIVRGATWPLGTGVGLARAIRLGAAGFLVVVVPTYLVHFGCLALFEWLGLSPPDHPMAHGPKAEFGGWTAYALAACVTVPAFEELICRGMVLPWAARRGANALAVFGVAALLAYGVGGDYGPAALAMVVTAAALAVGVAVLPGRVPRRTLGGILASATLFAALHANVWPTPVPLLVLGCGLGWVAARSGGIVAPVVLHGLFNAVAVVSVAMG